MVVIPSEPALKMNEIKNGAYFNFNVVSIDHKKITHRYNASMYVPDKEVDDWKKKIEPGNVFLINNAKWQMKDNPDFKYPLPQLQLDRFNTRKLIEPFWIEVEDE
jgi:hypothetical protein